MPLILTDCDESVRDMADELIRRYYQDIAESGLTIRYLFAENETAIGGPLKHHGYPAAAICKRNSYRDRVEGKTDVTITIDAEWWGNHSEDECRALLDHELYHILLARDDQGKIVTDDLGRPKVTLRPHDWQIGGFNAIVARHKLASVEVKSVSDVRATWRQMDLDFSE